MSADTHLLEEIRDLLRVQNALLEKLVSGGGAKNPAAGAAGGTHHSGWKAVRVPSWAKFDGGIPFGDLSIKSLTFWLNWQPRPYKDRPISETDKALRAALDEAQADIESGKHIPPERTIRPAGSQPQRGAPSAQHEPPPADPASITDEDVPF